MSSANGKPAVFRQGSIEGNPRQPTDYAEYYLAVESLGAQRVAGNVAGPPAKEAETRNAAPVQGGIQNEQNQGVVHEHELRGKPDVH